MLYHPLEQGFGLPLYFALTLIVPASARAMLWKLLAGVMLSLVVLLWGLLFSAIDDMFIQTGLRMVEFPEPGMPVAAAIHWCNALGVLILPTLAPVLLWLWLNLRFVRGLLPRISPDGTEQRSSDRRD